MNVIIPAAGLGTRLRPHTHHRPKPLVSVAGDTVLGHVMESLLAVDIDALVFIVGHLGDQIRDYVAQRYDVPAYYVVQRELLGQAHALALASEYLEGQVLIVFVDTILEADLSGLAATEADGVIFVRSVDDPRRFGVVTLDGEGHVSRFVEKPSEPVSDLAVVGIYYLKDGAALRAAVERLLAEGRQTKGEYYLADALQLMVEEGARLEAWPVDVWEDCGTGPALLQSNRFLLQRMEHSVPRDLASGNVFVPPVHVAPTAAIESSVIGPYVHVGSGCAVRHSVVGPHVSLAEGSVVEHSIVSDSILDARADVRQASLAASIIGADARVSGGHERLNVGDHSHVELAPPGG